ncbi:MAG: SpoIIE family protein phosphatase [Desulfobacterales bacterium]|nr:SpoIIE family protein phosphatase [Desulfobacterales bacterium]
MRYEDDILNNPLPISSQDTQQLSIVRQLLECRAKLKDSEINNRLLHELVFKYSELEKKLQTLNRELTVKQERIEQDLSAAARIQRSLLPKRLDSLEGLDVAWKFKPCEKIGGDIFNLIQLDNDHWAIYIIDVAGHGVSAAMVAVTVFQYLQPQGGNLVIRPSEFLKTQKIQRPARVLEFLDREYTFERFNNFFTMNYVVVNTKTGRLAASSAGHPPPIILRKDGTLELLKKGGRPIGTIDLRLSDDEPIVFEEERAQIHPTDKLLLYTDGVYEYQNEQGEFYGNERFVNIRLVFRFLKIVRDTSQKICYKKKHECFSSKITAIIHP